MLCYMTGKASIGWPGVREASASTTRAICSTKGVTIGAAGAQGCFRADELPAHSASRLRLTACRPGPRGVPTAAAATGRSQARPISARPTTQACASTHLHLIPSCAAANNGNDTVLHTKRLPAPPQGTKYANTHLHLRPAAAKEDAGVAHGLAQHAQRVVQRPLRLVQNVVACGVRSSGMCEQMEVAACLCRWESQHM